MKKSLLFLFVCLVFFSCNKSSTLSKIPKISFYRFSSESASISGDSTFGIFLKFEDGDGDIGFQTENLTFIQRFTPDTLKGDTLKFMIPEIPSRFEPKRGLSGTIKIDFETGFLKQRQDSVHKERDTISWKIVLRDQSGNVSDTAYTKDFIVLK